MFRTDKRNISPIIFTGSTTMIGVCLTVISLFIVTKNNTSTYMDEVLSLDTLFFIISAFVSYLSLRWDNHKYLELLADILFFSGMLVMVLAGILIAFNAL